MRIWDIPTDKLCRQHLLGGHRELHAIWSILVNNKKGYSNHPETIRWKGKLKALSLRHEQQVREMTKRGFIHRSPLDSDLAVWKALQKDYVDSIEKQLMILKSKNCECMKKLIIF